MKNITLLNGFNEKGVDKCIFNLIPYLQDFNLQRADYGYINLLGVRFFNDNFASLVAGMILPDSTIIAHSNGAAIAVEAAKITNKIKKLVLVNAALDKDTEFPDSLEEILVISNRYDFVVTASRALFWHPWGEMGRTGYIGTNNKITNVFSDDLFKVKGHSAVLLEHPEELANYIKNN